MTFYKNTFRYLLRLNPGTANAERILESQRYQKWNPKRCEQQRAGFLHLLFQTCIEILVIWQTKPVWESIDWSQKKITRAVDGRTDEKLPPSILLYTRFILFIHRDLPSRGGPPV